MKIKVARTAGFCMGVCRSIELALDAASDDHVYTTGSLIHNSQAIEHLATRNVKTIDPGEMPVGSTVVIRAHGLPPDAIAAYREHDNRVIDATCPHVVHSQRLLEREFAQGRYIILIGNANHPEILGLSARGGDQVCVISSVDEVSYVNSFFQEFHAKQMTDESFSEWLHSQPVSVLSQTTFDADCFDAIAKCLYELFSDIRVFKTICSSTSDRQNEVRDLARENKVVVVVGGRESSNTKHLATAAMKEGARVIWVETSDELCESDFAGVHSVAVTAGASTPGWITSSVVERLSHFGVVRKRDRLLCILSWLSNSRTLACIGVGCLAYAMARLIGVNISTLTCVVISLTAFTAYGFNLWKYEARSSLTATLFTKRFGSLLWYLTLFSGVICLVLSIFVSEKLFLLVLISHVASYLNGKYLRAFSLRRIVIPVSKDILVSAATTAWIVMSIWFESDELGWRRIFGAASILFLLTFAKTVTLDLRDIDADKLIGRETLPVAIGRRRAVLLTSFVLITMFFLILFFSFCAPFVIDCYFWLLFSLMPLYGLLGLHLIQSSRIRGEVNCQLLMDGQSFLACFLVFLHGVAQSFSLA